MTAANVRMLAITCEGARLSDPVDPRFGRAGGFLLVDLESMATTYLDNGSSQVLAQGAGIQAAEILARAGAQALLTGQVGPKALSALLACHIKVVQGADHMTAGEAVAGFQAGRFTWSDGPGC
jgi:predicted Fe-Mo cluster-binding NifX family protein